LEKINTQINEALDQVKKIDLSKLDAEMDHLKIEMKDLGPRIENEMQKANISIEKAKAGLKEYKVFIDGLEKDGLINKKEGYTIQHKNGDLIINGKKQPAEVYNKYSKFLQNHKKFRIEKSDDDFNMSNDDND
jgi:cytochrome oxidase Cu insertion factor (SCO1/SenC/PrrC family)